MKKKDVVGQYNLPLEVQFCKKCTVSNQRPRITFDEHGVCSACYFADYKRQMVDWNERERELEAPAKIIEIVQACIACVGRGALRVVPDPTHRRPRLRIGLCYDLARRRFNYIPRYDLLARLYPFWNQGT